MSDIHGCLNEFTKRLHDLDDLESVKAGNKMAVWITGDTHGDWMNRLKVDSFPEQKELTKNDFIIICGDFGIWDNSKREKYNYPSYERPNL